VIDRIALRPVANRHLKFSHIATAHEWPKLLHGRPHDIRLHHVVLAANFGCWRPISTPRYFGLGQGNLVSPDTGSVIGVFAYLISQGRSMAERNIPQAQQANDELRRVVGFSAADEIEKLDRLKKAGSISDAEFTRLRTQLL
jgi:hypothetical protein